jgi:membrane protein required for colicin V production
MGFAAIDVVFLVLIVVLAIRGAIRGFVTEIGSVAALVVGLGGAILFYKPLAALIGRLFGVSMWNPLIAFLILFLLLYLVIKLLERLLHAVFDKLNLERLDRAIGFFLGLAEGLLAVCVLLFLLNWQPLFDARKLLEHSLFARVLSPILPSPQRIFRHV